MTTKREYKLDIYDFYKYYGTYELLFSDLNYTYTCDFTNIK